MTPMTQSEPAVDVGMPAYRRPQFIGQAIASVLAQTHANWRLVVSENGPGGGDVEAAVREFTDDPRVHFVATGRNLGPAANWTRLIQQGSAPYVTLLQDDDVWDPGFLARRVAFLQRHRACAFVFSGERKIDGEGREIAVERTPSLPATDISEVLPQGTFTPQALVTAMYRHRLGGIHTPSIASVGVMSRRSALESVGPYFDDTTTSSTGTSSSTCAWRCARRPASWRSGTWLSDCTTRASPARCRSTVSVGSATTTITANGSGGRCRGSSCRGSSTSCAPRPTSSPRSTRSSRATAVEAAAVSAARCAPTRIAPQPARRGRDAGAAARPARGRRARPRRSARRERSETLVYEPAGTGVALTAVAPARPAPTPAKTAVADSRFHPRRSRAASSERRRFPEPPLGDGRADRRGAAIGGGRRSSSPISYPRPNSAASRWPWSSASSRWRSPTRARVALWCSAGLDHAHVQRPRCSPCSSARP